MEAAVAPFPSQIASKSLADAARLIAVADCRFGNRGYAESAVRHPKRWWEMNSFVQVITTTPDRAMAVAIAAELVARRLAACVQVGGPVTSTYRWRGNIETAEEWVCRAKCRAEHFDAVERAIAELHSYDVPEIIAVPIIAGSGRYLDWLAEETAPPI